VLTVPERRLANAIFSSGVPRWDLGEVRSALAIACISWSTRFSGMGAYGLQVYFRERRPSHTTGKAIVPPSLR